MHGDTFGSRTISRESSYTINSMQPSYIFICIVILYGEHTSVNMCSADIYMLRQGEVMGVARKELIYSTESEGNCCP